MVWGSAADALAASIMSPPYDAVIVCGPAESAEVWNVATPLSRKPMPRTFPPSKKVTNPDGHWAITCAGATAAVNVIGWPTSAVASDVERLIVVAPGLAVTVTGE